MALRFATIALCRRPEERSEGAEPPISGRSGGGYEKRARTFARSTWRDELSRRPEALARWMADCQSIEAFVRARLRADVSQLGLSGETAGGAATETDSTRPRGT